MAAGSESPLAASDLPEVVRKISLRTPARLLAGRAGAAYRTRTDLTGKEADVEAALKQNPKSVRALAMLAELQSQAKAFAKALTGPG